jgi:GntR family transcriptional regulator, transcriptional repressor for pyruvate dehydrogenase complex
VADLTTARDVLYIMDIRIGLESEAAALAAKNRTEDDMRAINLALAELHETHGMQPRYDAELHLAIARATHNHYFADLLGDLAHLLIPPLRVKLAHTSDEERAVYLQHLNQEHSQIVRAIAQGDTEAARAAMRIHLVNGRDRLHQAFEDESRLTPSAD